MLVRRLGVPAHSRALALVCTCTLAAVAVVAPLAQPVWSAPVQPSAVSTARSVVGTAFTPTNGQVLATAVIGSTVYAGGTFTSVNSPSGTVSQPYLAAFNLTTGAFVSSWRPVLSGEVDALAVQGGRLLVGGRFQAVDGRRTGPLVALDTTSGLLASPAVPTVSGGLIDAIKVTSGTVYAGGFVWKANDALRGGVFAFRTSDMKVLPFAPLVTDGHVKAIEISPDGTEVYLGGTFKFVNLRPRTRHLAVVDALTGISDPRFQSLQPERIVYGLSVSNGYLWIAGGSQGGALEQRSLTSFALLREWDTDGDAQAVLGFGKTVAIGGHWENMNGVPCAKLMFLDTTTLNLSCPSALKGPLGVWAMTTPSSGALVLGGDLNVVDGQRTGGLAKLAW
jgi:hypothetical protein